MRFIFSMLFLFFTTALIGQSSTSYLLVGTYTKPKNKGEGIYVYRFNSNDGSAKLISKIETENPSYLTVSKNKKYVYAVNQNGNIKTNEASAFALDNMGNLTFINKQKVNGESPCYITVDKKNNWIFTANYTSGNISSLPINKDGSLSEVKQLIQHAGSSIVKDRQSIAHAHTVVLTPNNKFLVATDLGTDKIKFYSFSSKQKQNPLTIDSTNDIICEAGSGPRHLAFSKNKRMMYAINELNGTITVYKYRNATTQLLQKISTDTSNALDKGSADIHLSNDEKFLYASNRGSYNNIAIYSIDDLGKLKFIALQSTLGKTPRNFVIDPTDNFLLVANQNSDNIIVFKRNKETGLLQETGVEIKVGTPVCLQMIEVE